MRKSIASLIRSPWSVVVLLAIAFAVSWLDRMIINLLIGPIKADFDLSDIQIGLLSGTGFSLCYAGFGVIVGGLVDQCDRKRIIIVGMLIWSVMTAAAGLAASFGQLLAARCVVAAGEACLSPATFVLIGDRFPREKVGRAIGIYYLGSVIGPGLALVIGSWLLRIASGPAAHWYLISARFPWQRVFILAALPGMFVMLLLWLLLPQSLPPARGDDRAVPNSFSIKIFLRVHGVAYVGLTLGISLTALFMNGILTWGAIYGVRRFGLPIERVGAMFGYYLIVAGCMGALFGGALADHMVRRGHGEGPLRAIIILVGIGLVFAILIPFASSIGMFMVTISGGVFAVLGSNVVGPAAVQAIAPAAGKGRLSAIYLTIVSLIGMGGGPVLIPLLAGNTPSKLGVGIAIAGLISFGGATACLLSIRSAYARSFLENTA